MRKNLIFFLGIVAFCAQARDGQQPVQSTEPLCSGNWYRSVEARVGTSDAQMHGPDIGSEEWKSVIEFKLGVRDKPDVPNRASEDWCRYIDQLVWEGNSMPGSKGNSSSAETQGTSYACDGVSPNSTEAMICGDQELSALDRKLSEVYAAASSKAVNEHPPMLKTEQRGWIKGRNDCWKSDNERECVRNEYINRIAELQARYRLVSGHGPISFACDGNPANEVTITFFQTDPPTLIAERGDSVSLMYLQPSASGARYQGGDNSFWEHQGEAMITWGFGAPQMRCKKMP